MSISHRELTGQRMINSEIYKQAISDLDRCFLAAQNQSSNYFEGLGYHLLTNSEYVGIFCTNFRRQLQAVKFSQSTVRDLTNKSFWAYDPVAKIVVNIVPLSFSIIYDRQIIEIDETHLQKLSRKPILETKEFQQNQEKDPIKEEINGLKDLIKDIQTINNKIPGFEQMLKNVQARAAL